MSDVQVTFGGNTAQLEAAVDRASDAVRDFNGPVIELSGSVQKLQITFTTANAAAGQFQVAIDAANASVDDHVQSINQLKTASENASSGYVDLAKSARDAGGGLAETVEHVLNTINHLKLLALAAYAMSPAFRSIANTGIAAALKTISPAAADATRSITSFAAPALAFFGRMSVPIGAAVLAWEGLNKVITTGAELVDKYDNAQRKLYDAPDLQASLDKLTKFQNETISPEQAQWATQLASKLAEAKQQISEFLKIQLDLTGPALELQSIWVGIVGAIGDAAWGLNHVASEARTFGNSSFFTQLNEWSKAHLGNWGLGSLPGTLQPAPAGETGGAPQHDDAEALKLAINKLAAAMGGGFAGRFSGEVTALANPPKPETAPPRDADAARAAIAAMQGEITASNLVYQTQVENLTAAVSLTRISEQQKLQFTLAAIGQREAAELTVIDATLKRDDLSLTERQRVENEKTKILAGASKDREKIAEQEAKLQQQQVASIVEPFERAWDSQLSGMLRGTETFGTAMKKMFADIVLDGIKEFEKLALFKPLENMLSGGSASGPGTLLGLLGGGGAAGGQSLGLLGSLTSGIGKLFGQGTSTAESAAQLTATTANTTAMTGLTAATTVGSTELTANTTASTVATTAVTGSTTAAVADATATTASTGVTLTGISATILNTAALVPNTIATIANTIATAVGHLIPSFAVGSYSVPSNMVAQVHAGEMIMPAAAANNFRNMLSSSGPFGGGAGGGGDTHVHFNVSSIDGADVQRFFVQNSTQILRIIQSATILNPSLK